MKKFIATFYSHFGAMRFSKNLKKLGIESKLMPVPRSLSSSCGTCAMFEAEIFDKSLICEETEQVVEIVGDDYISVFCSQ